MDDQVFRDPAVRDQDSFRVILNGKLLPHSWNSKGSAQTGLEVERRRAQKLITQ
jgi:hypothetical protein